MGESLLTAEEVARLLRVTTRTVQKWAASGELPAVLLGKKLWRFDRAAVKAWVERAGRP
jgi:excisionase family DNA binding protein